MSHSAYPYDDLAVAIFVSGGAALAIAALVLTVAMVRWKGAPRTSRARFTFAAVCLSSSLLLAVVLLVVNIHWYAGARSRCFLDEDALEAILLLAPLGILLAVGAAFLLARFPASRLLARWHTAGLALATVLALVLGIRWLGVLCLQTVTSADAVLLDGCVEDPQSFYAPWESLEPTSKDV